MSEQYRKVLGLDLNPPKVCFLPWVGEFGWYIMNHVKRIHGYNSQHKIACIKRGHECLFPTVAEFFYDWQDIPPDKKAGVSKNPHEEELKARLRDKFGDVLFANPQDTSWEEKTSLANFTFKPVPLHNHNFSVDVVIAPRHRRIDPNRNYKNWQKLANRLGKLGYAVAACGTQKESFNLRGVIRSWNYIDVDTDVEIINKAKVVIVQDSGLAYLAMLCDKPLIIIGNCQKDVINAHRDRKTFIRYASTHVSSPPVLDTVIAITKKNFPITKNTPSPVFNKAECDFHPKTGLHYINVINNENLAYLDYHAAYAAMSQRVPWVSVITPREFVEQRKTLRYMNDDRFMYILWHTMPQMIDPPSERGARLAHRYTELIGDFDGLLNHRKALSEFTNKIHYYDLVFVHNNYAKDYFKKYTSNVHIAPLGYDRDVLGSPNFEAEKEHDMVFYGGVIGKRKLLVDLRDKMARELYLMPGNYGLDRHKVLNRSKAVVHTQQVDKSAFATMRLWQTIASSAAMLLEPIDAFPAVPGRHYVEIPSITAGNIDTVAGTVDDILENTDLLAIAKRAHEELAHMTVRYCFEKFVVR
jgi:hypothetical protein